VAPRFQRLVQANPRVARYTTKCMWPIDPRWATRPDLLLTTLRAETVPKSQGTLSRSSLTLALLTAGWYSRPLNTVACRQRTDESIARLV
jgi:hypothetical protein